MESDRKPTLIRGLPGSKRLYFRKPRYDNQSVGYCRLGDGLLGPYEMIRRYFGSPCAGRRYIDCDVNPTSLPCAF